MSRKFIILVLALFAVVLVGFFAVLRWSGFAVPSPRDIFGTPPNSGPAAAPQPPSPPPAPSVSLTVLTSKKGNHLVIHWANLPESTIALDIYRSPKDKDQWALWKTIALKPGDLADGSADFSVGTSTLSNYSFSVQAVGGNNNASSTPTSTLWTSSSTQATVEPAPTSTPPTNTNTNTNPTPQTPSLTTPSSTTQNPSSTNPTVTSSTTGTSTTTSSGTPFYSPSLQISSYSNTQSGSFWVQHVDQRIQIGWQSLPSSTTSFAVARSQAQNGPWSTIITQQNPATTGSDSVQIVDATVNEAYYYEMNVYAGTTLIATYGPDYLPAVQ